jgi:hypothetical protein
MKWIKRFILAMLAAIGLGFLAFGAAAPAMILRSFVIAAC